jgi:4-hydroxythreonine-4-phosphate dehydrogenase
MQKNYFLALVFSMLSLGLFAQSGEISGKITDENGEGIPFASVAIVDNGTPTGVGATTDFDGFYSIKPLSPGKYDVQFSNIGYTTIRELGEETEIAGKYALDAINQAISDWKEGKIDALITAPINKHSVAKAAEGSFSGHTEYLARETGAKDSLMVLFADTIRMGLVTNHIPVSEISSKLSKEIVQQKIEMLNRSLVQDFFLNKPRIAVLSLNPHAGDKGLIGSEELEILVPAINQCYRNGILAFGPYPADGLFGSGNFKKFDAVLAIYHDQGLTPFKALTFDDGVNFTAGLDIIRTSPDHGTAFDIAGKNLASPQSMRQALFAALDIVESRAEYKEWTADKLKTRNRKSRSRKMD